MKRKCLTVGLILLLIGTSIIPITAQDFEKSLAQTSNALTQKIIMNQSLSLGGGFGLQSVIYISWGNEIEEPLVPYGEIRNVTLNVTYYTILCNAFISPIILRYCILTHKFVFVELDTVDTPSWCIAGLNKSVLRFPITGYKSSQTVSLYIQVDNNAPAYELFPVTINVSVDTMLGPFSILPLINGFYNDFMIPFYAAYNPLISVTPEYSIIETTPGTTFIDSIIIENLGNGKTIVYNNVDNCCPSGWDVIISVNTVLEVNESKIANLSIKTPIDFYGFETLLLSFTPHYYDNWFFEGSPTYLTINVEVRP